MSPMLNEPLQPDPPEEETTDHPFVSFDDYADRQAENRSQWFTNRERAIDAGPWGETPRPWADPDDRSPA